MYAVRQALPGVVIGVRMDSALFSDELVHLLQVMGVQFTIFALPSACIRVRKRTKGWLEGL